MSDVNNGETPKQHFVCDKDIAQCPDQKHLDLRKTQLWETEWHAKNPISLGREGILAVLEYEHLQV